MKRFSVLTCICALIVVVAAGSSVAAPEFQLVAGPLDVGNGEFQFQYKLTNFGSTVPIYDVEFDYSIAAAWIRVEGPDDWAMNWEGPLAAWQTDVAPCDVETEMYGFYIYAGGPEYYLSPITFTDHSHAMFATGDALLPVPEPGSMLVLGSGLIALAGTILRKRR